MPFNLSGRENLLKAIELLKEFDTKNPDERICEALSLQWCCKAEFIVCSHCNHQQNISGDLRRMYLCSKCSKQIWVTAGTFFDHVRKFRPYLATMYIYERGVILSASDLSKLLGVSLSMASLISKKITFLISEILETSGREVLSSTLSAVVCRRSIETPQRQHPLAEEVEIRKELALRENNVQQPESKMPEMSRAEAELLELLSEIPMTFSEICQRMRIDCPTASATIVFLELRDLITCIHGDRYVRKDKEASDAKNSIEKDKGKTKYAKMVNRFIKFVEERFQGISRKYLQLYLALFWIFMDRKRWGPNSILSFCTSSKHVPYQKILAYLTPTDVKLPRTITV
ncbi:MAG TPA: hypothetical protein PKZ32_15300 [Candidatus Melainabacteria bacterium]|nr:hypothetical protein [Candidatus Melainabacteria bacterium]